MHAENDHASGRATDINTPFTAEPDEIPPKDGAIKCLIPDAARLLHAVDALEELPHPIVFPRSFETRGLLHEHSFIGWQDTMEESCFYVKLVEVPVQRGGEMRNSLEGF